MKWQVWAQIPVEELVPAKSNLQFAATLDNLRQNLNNVL
jgi:hypothetical protein